MEFIVGNYAIFIIIAVVLLLGLFGYIMDRKKYEKYREEIINEERIADAFEAAPGGPMNQTMQAPAMPQASVAPQAPVGQEPPVVPMQPGQPLQQVNTQIPNN